MLSFIGNRTPKTLHFDLLRRMCLRAEFVLALHEMPAQRLADVIESIGPAQIVPLAELVQRKKEGKRSFGSFAITVDDGVGYNVRALAQLFLARAWPATFYLPTQYLDTGEPMAFQWWRRLKPLLPPRKLKLKSGVLDLSRPGAVEALSRSMEQRWRRERPETYLPLISELADIVAQEIGVTRVKLRAPGPISWSEVAELSRNDLIRFESHGVSHAAMSALTEEEIVFEMGRSQRLIEEHTGRPCRHLCYPFGSRTSIGHLSPRIASRFYDSAVTMELGATHDADPWLLPRIPLYPENSLLFARMKILLTRGMSN